MVRTASFFSLLTILIAYPVPSFQLLNIDGGGLWVSQSDISLLASRCSIDPQVFRAKYCDVGIDDAWGRLIDCNDVEQFCSVIQNENPPLGTSIQPFPYLGAEVAKFTFLWCNEFVAKLGLCPWAKLSLSRPGTVRVRIIRDSTSSHNLQSALEKTYECAIRNAASELLYVTGRQTALLPNSERNDVLCAKRKVGDPTEEAQNTLKLEGPPAIDPKLAITFVVLAPSEPKVITSMPNQLAFSFPHFHEFINDLESKLFDEADSGISSTGDLVTMAGFHPNWEFYGLQGSPLNYEKRSPYPTVSLVLTEGIDEAGEEATEQIAKHNKKILNSIGTRGLENLFQKKVLRLKD
jgi:hypothetical protein